jgi:hypothetical protein
LLLHANKLGFHKTTRLTHSSPLPLSLHCFFDFNSCRTKKKTVSHLETQESEEMELRWAVCRTKRYYDKEDEYERHYNMKCKKQIFQQFEDFWPELQPCFKLKSSQMQELAKHDSHLWGKVLEIGIDCISNLSDIEESLFEGVKEVTSFFSYVFLSSFN